MPLIGKSISLRDMRRDGVRVVQSVIVSREAYPSLDRAIAAVRELGYHASRALVDPRESHWRFRQLDPPSGARYVTTATRATGISCIVMY